MSEATRELAAGFPARVRIPVQWGDMDAYGHVNNAVYFRWFESARIEYLGLCGFLESYEEDRVGPILHSTSCRFRRALSFPDEVLVGGRASSVGEDRFEMEYRVVSVTGDAVAAEGTGLIVSFDYRAGEKRAIPAAIRTRIEEMESEAPPPLR